MQYEYRIFSKVDRLLATAFIVLVVGICNGAANAAIVKNAPAGKAAAAIARTGEDGLANGDTLKITFYEAIGSRTLAGSQPPMSTLVERSEMSGQYVIQLDGTIYVPLIGTIKAAGLTPEGLEHNLETKSAFLFRRTVQTTVRLVKREPVYVTGGVPQPGAFTYTPGMTVLHAMILAGMRTEGPESPERINVMQETEHLRKSEAKLAELISHRDVLVALRDGAEPMPSAALINLIGAARAVKLVRVASRLAKLEVKKEGSQEAGLNKALAAINVQRNILTQSVKDASVEVKHATVRFNFVSGKRKQGLITADNFSAAQGNLDAARVNFDTIRASLARLEERAAELQRKQATILMNAAIARQREIDNLNSSIRETEVTRDTIEPVLGFTSATFRDEKAPIKITILRRTVSGMIKIPATEYSPLDPGDIIDVFKSVPAASVNVRSLVRRRGYTTDSGEYPLNRAGG